MDDSRKKRVFFFLFLRLWREFILELFWQKRKTDVTFMWLGKYYLYPAVESQLHWEDESETGLYV